MGEIENLFRVLRAMIKNTRDVILEKLTSMWYFSVDKYFWTNEADWLNQGVIHGNWTLWSRWSPCSVTLGVGVKRRIRMCMNPPPSNGGRRCLGASVEYMECRVEQPLKGKHNIHMRALV